MNKKIRRIGVVNGGGDCPGLNPVIRAVVRTAINEFGWEVWGIGQGFDGLAFMDSVRPLSHSSVRGILPRGGTILGTKSGAKLGAKADDQDSPMGKRYAVSILSNFRELGLDALVAIGGDGTLGFAQELSEMGLPLVAVPKTIDNDLSSTGVTFGFGTAVDTATEALDKLHTTAESHQRTMVLEVMGRYVGWIALHSGVAGGAHAILVPEIPYDIDVLAKFLGNRMESGRRSSIVVIAEGARQANRAHSVKTKSKNGQVEVLGGAGNHLAMELEQRLHCGVRCTVLGHLQRGGSPNAYDRILGSRFGSAAVHALADGDFGKMVALRTPNICRVPLAEATAQLKTIPMDDDLLVAARGLGICFGDDLRVPRALAV